MGGAADRGWKRRGCGPQLSPRTRPCESRRVCPARPAAWAHAVRLLTCSVACRDLVEVQGLAVPNTRPQHEQVTSCSIHARTSHAAHRSLCQKYVPPLPTSAVARGRAVRRLLRQRCCEQPQWRGRGQQQGHTGNGKWPGPTAPKRKRMRTPSLARDVLRDSPRVTGECEPSSASWVVRTISWRSRRSSCSRVRGGETLSTWGGGARRHARTP